MRMGVGMSICTNCKYNNEYYEGPEPYVCYSCKTSGESEVWFTADQHYGHKNIIEFCNRPFTDLHHMHKELTTRHNDLVKDDDVVWHLGDFAMDHRLVPTILSKLRGKHVLVAGNHDKCHPCHKRHQHFVQKYLQYGFATVWTNTVYREEFILNHLPYAGDSAHEPRYPEWRPKDEGGWLLHGHVHELWKVKDRMINVGVDQWDYAPVSVKEVRRLVTCC
jgi:calcineurin-like phosphoesterase family protein